MEYDVIICSGQGVEYDVMLYVQDKVWSMM